MAHITLDTAYLADNYSTPMESGLGIVMARYFKFTVTAAFVVNDLVKLTKLAPGNAPGWVLLDIFMEVPDLDTSTGFVLQLGDSTAADRYVTTTLAAALGTTAGRINSRGPSIPYAASTAAAGTVVGALPAYYAAADNLVLKVQTAATGTAATTGTISGYITYTQQGITDLSDALTHTSP